MSGHISEPEINCGMRERRKIILDRGSRNTQCTSICKVCETRIVSQDEITEVESRDAKSNKNSRDKFLAKKN